MTNLPAQQMAPDIVEAIIEGRQPRTLTVKRLLRGIPLSCADHRAPVGFRGRSDCNFPVTLRSRSSRLRPNPDCDGTYGSQKRDTKNSLLRQVTGTTHYWPVPRHRDCITSG